MQFHPFAEKFPLLEGEEWEAFKAGIKASGGNKVQPILYRVVGGKAQGLAGRNRLKACKELRLKPTMKKVSVKDDDVLEFILADNVRRRHMTPELRKTIVIALRETGESTREIAETIGTSHATVNRDIHEAEATGTIVPPAEIETKAGKTYTVPDNRCGKCKRTFPNSRQSVKDCQACVAEKANAKRKRPREPGDESKDRKPASKSGKLLHDWKTFHAAYGALLREIDKFGTQHKCKESPIAKGLRNTLKHWLAEFDRWFFITTEVKAPKH